MMAWVNPPATRADVPVAFADLGSVEHWLAGLPRANISAMLAALGRELSAFNQLAVPARERFKVLEFLRRPLFALSAEARRRYEYKPLPLSDNAAATLAAVRELWRALAVGYWHCLAAALAGKDGFARHGLSAAHRMLTALRQEQLHGDLARHALAEGFWALAAVALDGAGPQQREWVEDRLLSEPSKSTPFGQYAMLHLLVLAKPAALSRAQYAAVTRWLVRWRELAEDGGAGQALRLDKVLRKIRKRREALAEGAAPEALKLGDTLSAPACDELLAVLGERLAQPGDAPLPSGAEMTPVAVVCGLDNIFHRLGGHGLLDDWQATTTSLVSRLRQERQAEAWRGEAPAGEAPAVAHETWQLVMSGNERAHLYRPADSSARLSLRSLLAVEVVSGAHPAMLEVEALAAHDDGRVRIEGRFLPGRAQPLLAAMCDRTNGRETRHPVFGLQTVAGGDPARALLPAGLAPRAARLKLLDLSLRPAPYSLAECVGRGDEFEMWRLSPE